MSNFPTSLKSSTDDQLWDYINNSSPQFGSLASDELTRRSLKELTESLEKSSSSTDRYNKALFFLTFQLFVIGLMQLILFSITLPGIPGWARIVGTIMVAGAIIVILAFSRKKFLT
ncbi:MAG: hypothetical protein JWM39_891 [Parcubacteria group bacterium]|nr:hypothetical protein [Parcubacteria group bacterium]